MQTAKGQGSDTLFYRGHADVKYTLSPTVYRKSPDGTSFRASEHYLYEEMLRRDPREREALVKSHAAWTAWRDAELARTSILYEGGSIRPLFVNSQYEAITRERIASLQTSMHGPEGPRIVSDRLLTPTNLLEHVVPGAPAERVRKWLGAPTAIHGSVWIYRYVETQVQVTVDDRDVVKEVVVALVALLVVDVNVAAMVDNSCPQSTT